MSTWLVIANSTEARIYDITQTAPKVPHYHPIKAFSHGESRLKTSELMSDGNGSYQSQGGPKSSYEPSTDAHEKEIQHFAKEIAHYLDAERAHNHFKHLILCAGPHFHHLLNEAMSKQTALLVKKHIEKDYIPLPKAQLHEIVEKIYQDSLLS